MGRPRVHPEGSTASDRVKAADEALRREGGKRLTIRLSGEAVRAIVLLRAEGGYLHDVEAIEAALLAEAKRAWRRSTREPAKRRR